MKKIKRVTKTKTETIIIIIIELIVIIIKIKMNATKETTKERTIIRALI